MQKAFTLIELLVVILIIATLSAIALPKYQRAVMRARYVQVETLASSMWNAEQAYHALNGKWTVDFRALDIQVPVYQEWFTSENGKLYGVRVTKDDYCYLGGSGANMSSDSETYLEKNLSYIWCHNSPHVIGYKVIPSSGKRYCTSSKNNDKAAAFCRSLTGGEKETWTAGYDQWEITKL